MIDRVLQGSTPTISVTITAGTTPVNPSPDTATVTIRRANGTVIVNEGTALDGGTGIFNFTLTPTHTALLDVLRAEWTITLDGQPQTRATYHEVVGGYLISLAELGGLYPDASDTELANRRTFLEDTLEKALRRALVPRYFREVKVPRRNVVFLSWTPVRMLRELLLDGTAWASETLNNAALDPITGKLAYVPLMRLGATATVAYEHGEDYPDIDVARAMTLLAQETYGNDYGSLDSRVVRREADGQAITYASPSLSGGAFVTPELNRIINSSRRILIR